MTDVDARKAANELLMLLDGLLQMGNELLNPSVRTAVLRQVGA